MPKDNISLAPYTTFKIGGLARYFFECKSIEDIKEAAEFAKDKSLPIFILGGGSNILIRDEGFSGVVILVSLKGVEISQTEELFAVEAAAGENWDSLVELLISKNIGGLENLSAIPGSVGATPVQNIGAYGSEVSSFIKEVHCFDTKNLKEKIFTNSECEFSYRDSIFKREENKNLVVTKVIFNFLKKYDLNISYRDLTDYFANLGEEPTAKGIRTAVMNVRAAKLPDVKIIGTAGSFFKNPIVEEKKAEEILKIYPELPIWGAQGQVAKKKLSAAYLIDKVCEMKGESVGKATIWPKQALVLINSGNATAKDILSLAKKIEDCVKEKTGIFLEKEVEIVG